MTQDKETRKETIKKDKKTREIDRNKCEYTSNTINTDTYIMRLLSHCNNDLLFNLKNH